jgi:hypothetical protein
MKNNTAGLTLNQKIKYYWDYYRTITIVGIILLVVAISLVKTITSNKVKHDAYCLILNDTNNSELADRIKTGFPQFLNDDGHSISVDYSYPFYYNEEHQINWPDESAIVKIMSLIDTKNVYVAIADYNTMLWAVYENYIIPMDEILPDDLLNKLEPNYEYAKFQGEEQTDGKIYGLDISETEVYQGYSDQYENTVVFIPNFTTKKNRKNQQEEAIKFIQYLFQIR